MECVLVTRLEISDLSWYHRGGGYRNIPQEILSPTDATHNRVIVVYKEDLDVTAFIV